MEVDQGGCYVPDPPSEAEVRLQKRLAKIESELYNLRIANKREGEWGYDSLARILKDELPLTMTLGLLTILVRRMVGERLFAEPVEGLVAAVEKIAQVVAEAAKESEEASSS